MVNAHFTGLYTLTPTHCGTGQTSGAVDLPIAREAHTGFPVLPASSLKGASRHAFRNKMGKDQELFLFGSDVIQSEATTSRGQMKPGALVIMEGRLLVYPLRSLQQPFLYATCPLVLERLDRDARAFGIKMPPSDQWLIDVKDGVFITEKHAGKPLIIEDFVYKESEVHPLPVAEQLGDVLAGLLPAAETTTRNKIKESLVVLGNNEFADLIRRVMPVQARIRLTDEKTTTGEGGNLWYEETLPSDCLFGVFITRRPGLGNDGDDPCKVFINYLGAEKSMQIGGNETVGQGYCWWTAMTSSKGD